MDEIQNNDNLRNPAAIDARVAHRLRGLAEDIAAFVTLQNARLERLIGAKGAGGNSQREIDRRQAELDRREREFESRERETQEQVDDECRKLTAAWDQLEIQQRQLLAQGSGAAPAVSMQQSQLPQPAAASSSLPGSGIDLIGDIAMPAANPAAAQPWSREPAAQQFQQMKREIRRHARRRKT